MQITAKSTSDLVVRHIEPEEREAAANLVALSFARTQNRHRRLRHIWLNHLPAHPDDKLDDYRAAFVNGELVSLARVQQRSLHYGQVMLPVACIGSICTHPDYRRRGYSLAVMDDTLTYVAQQGTPFVLLDGIAGYYERFGFSPVWPRYSMQAASEDAANLPQALSLREANSGDIPKLAALYKQHWSRRVTFNRSPALWLWRVESEPDKLAIAVTDNGQIEGYIWHDDTRKSRVEVIAETPAALATLLAYDGQRWKERGKAHFMWSMPPDDVIVSYAQQMLPITLATHLFPSGSWMGRVIDFDKFVNSILPEIIAHARAEHFHFDPRVLMLGLQSNEVNIGLRHDPNSYCKLSLQDFVRLLFGSLRPETLTVRDPLTRESIAMLNMLFPPRIANIAAWDWF